MQDAAERETFLAALDRARGGGAADRVVARGPDRRHLRPTRGSPASSSDGLYLLAGMTQPDLRAAIEEPARLASLVVEPGLVDLLVNEVADQPGALPLMSHALAETWQRREGRTLTVAGYNASGGIRGAVAQSAEQVYERVPAEQRTVLRDLLLRLVAPGPDGEPVRSRLPRRLVVTGPDNDAMIDLLVGVAAGHQRRRRRRTRPRVAGPRLAAAARLARRRPRRPAHPAPPGGRRRLLGQPRPPRQRALPRRPPRQGPRLARAHSTHA